jgi:hypothetical protein
MIQQSALHAVGAVLKQCDGAQYLPGGSGHGRHAVRALRFEV